MNTRPPLAAALLLLASAAAAQPYAAGAGAGFSMTGVNTNAFSFSLPPGPVDDVVFKCGTVPYIACTDVHMNKREAIRIAGRCPEPASPACVEFLMKNSASANPAETIAAYTPPPGREWASPTCQRIPCRLADAPSAVGFAAGFAAGPPPASSSYEDEPGFIGPPSPPKSSLPPAFDAKDFQKELAAARAESQNTIVDMGDNRYGVVLDDGTVAVCGNGLCSRPRPASEFPKLADQIQLARNESFSFNGASAGGRKNTGSPSVPGPDNAGKTNGSPNPADEVTSASDEARGSGNDAGNFFRSGSDDSGSRSGSGAGSGGSDGYASAAGKDQVIKTKAAELDGVYTYNKTQEIKATIEKTAGAVTGGVDGTFATPANTPDANAGDLKFKGTRSGSNQ